MLKPILLMVVNRLLPLPLKPPKKSRRGNRSSAAIYSSPPTKSLRRPAAKVPHHHLRRDQLLQLLHRRVSPVNSFHTAPCAATSPSIWCVVNYKPHRTSPRYLKSICRVCGITGKPTWSSMPR